MRPPACQRDIRRIKTRRAPIGGVVVAKGGKFRELMVGLGVSAATVIGCLVLAELLLRLLPVATGLGSMPVDAAHPIFRFRPNSDFTFSRDWDLDLANRGHVNNDGFINNQDYVASGKQPLVAVIGDSYVEAAMVPYAQTFHGLLSEAFRDKLRVYSFGASGAPLSQYLVWARYAVSTYGARALVINVVGNDFDESRIEFKAASGFWYYAPDKDGALALRLVEYRPDALTRLVRQSALLRYLAINLRAQHNVTAALARFRGGGAAPQPEQQYAGNTSAEASSQRVALSKQAVDRFLADIQQLGLPKPCIVFTLDGFRYPDAKHRGAGTFFDVMRRYFLERAAASGLEAIDLDPDFLKRHAEPAERFEYPNDAHWNPNGHRIAAQALKASRMLQSGCEPLAASR